MATFLTRPNGRYLSIASLLIFFWLATHTSLQKNPTTDEPVHVTRGITLWQHGDYRLQQEHTPLSHWVNGLLTQTEPLPDVTTRDGWADHDRLRVARDLIWHSGLAVERLFFLARLPIILLGLLSGAILLNWSKATAGHTGQAITAVLFAFAPNMLAHAALATTDFVATAGYLATLYALWRYQKRPNPPRYLVVGLLLGLALAAKMTNLLLWHILLILLYSQKRPTQPLLTPLVRWLGWFPIAGLIVWGLYRFTLGPVYIPQLDLAFTLPAPAYWHSFFGVSNHIDGGHRAFFLGQISPTGWWHYFTVALWLKTPILLLFGAVTGTLLALQRPKKERAALYFWFPALALFLAATFSRLNIGYRHILPIVPLLQLWTALTLTHFLRTDWHGRLSNTLACCLLIYAGVNLYHHPHHLSYFNLLAGGPSQGHRYLGDSNLDWGQDWQIVADYVKQSRLTETFIAPFGFVDPSYYGLNGERLVLDSGFANDAFSPANPSAGTYFLSTNGYQGMLAQPDLFDWFRRQTAVDLRGTGYSIRRYDVAAPVSGTWIAHCASPTPLLDEPTAEQLLNTAEIRHLYFDCEQSWVFPENGRAGWYILPQHITPSWVLADYPTALRPVYAHTATVFAPSYHVYYWDGSAAIPHTTTADPLGDVVQLIGYTAVEPTLWRTIWQVTAETSLPLSIFAHLYPQTAVPAPPITADGLGLPTTNWRTGDIFVQTHHFTNTPPTPAIDRLETGFYDYTTQERLPTSDGQTAITLPRID